MTRSSRLSRHLGYGHLLFVLPGLVVFAAFKLYPMAAAFPLSTMEWTGLGGATRFVGLDNYARALTDPDFYRAIRHNAVFFLAILAFQHTVGLFLAVQLNAKPRFMELYRTILFLPVILSLVATGFIWTLMLSPNIGIVNPMLEHMGLGFLAQPWLNDVTWALPSVIAVQVEAIDKAVSDAKRGRRQRGASTISQQVAKNLFLWPAHSWLRKGLEAWFTLWIEWLWPKQRILEVYLNSAEFGRGVWGVEAASRYFFHKPAARLNRNEAALLAAVLPNPKHFRVDRPSPYVQQRQAWIMRQMTMLGGIRLLDGLEE